MPSGCVRTATRRTSCRIQPLLSHYPPDTAVEWVAWEQSCKGEAVSRWTDAELFWIIENGIKDSGMIALGPTHQEQDIWAVAAFVRQLPEMTPERYHELVTEYQSRRSAKAQTSAHRH